MPARLVEDALTWVLLRPWLAAVGAVLLLVWIGGRNLVAGWRHRRRAAGARLVTIAPPPLVEAAGAAALWANLAGILTPSRRRRILYGVAVRGLRVPLVRSAAAGLDLGAG